MFAHADDWETPLLDRAPAMPRGCVFAPRLAACSAAPTSPGARRRRPCSSPLRRDLDPPRHPQQPSLAHVTPRRGPRPRHVRQLRQPLAASSSFSSPSVAPDGGEDGAGGAIPSEDDVAFGAEGGGYLEVEGCASPLEGVASVSGAKNAVLALLAGTLACREPVTLHSVPLLKDVVSMLDVLRSVGVQIHVGAAGPGSVTIDAGVLSSTSPDKAAVQALRASFFAAVGGSSWHPACRHLVAVDTASGG